MGGWQGGREGKGRSLRLCHLNEDYVQVCSLLLASPLARSPALHVIPRHSRFVIERNGLFFLLMEMHDLNYLLRFTKISRLGEEERKTHTHSYKLRSR